MTSPYTQISTRQTPQTQPIPGPVGARQVPNSAGGFVFAVDRWTRLQRFLILGTEGGSYYASEQKLTADNAKVVFECVAEDGLRVVDILTDISTTSRAPKVQPTLLALAICAAADDKAVREATFAAMPKICRTATHLFMWVGYVKQFRGTGSQGIMNAISKWYMDREPGQAAYQIVKYRSREGYTHRDILRIAHPKPDDSGTGRTFASLFNWTTKNVPIPEADQDALSPVIGFEQLQAAESGKDAAKILRDRPGLPWETVKPDHQNEPEVWHAILDAGMPYNALVRQLPRLTRLGVTTARKADIVGRLRDPEVIAKSRIHPFALLLATVTYAQGQGRGGRDWTPEAQVVDALNDAFYLAFGNVQPANKRTLLALDVSGSMDGSYIAGTLMSARVASSAMALVTAATEPDYTTMAFCREFVHLPISPRQRMDDVLAMTNRLPFGGTDCALPLTWALKNKVLVDTVVIYTDNESWAGPIHVTQALDNYRQATGLPTRLIAVGMTATRYTVADPNDTGSMDVTGFDAAAPNLIAGFSRGEF